MEQIYQKDNSLIFSAPFLININKKIGFNKIFFVIRIIKGMLSQ